MFEHALLKLLLSVVNHICISQDVDDYSFVLIILSFLNFEILFHKVKGLYNVNIRLFEYGISVADREFLERGIICIKVWGFSLLISLIFLKYPMKMK